MAVARLSQACQACDNIVDGLKPVIHVDLQLSQCNVTISGTSSLHKINIKLYESQLLPWNSDCCYMSVAMCFDAQYNPNTALVKVLGQSKLLVTPVGIKASISTVPVRVERSGHTVKVSCTCTCMVPVMGRDIFNKDILQKYDVLR